MDTLLNYRLEDLTLGDWPVTAGAMALMGVLYCFVGYRLFRFLLGFTGFGLAGGAAAAMAGWVSQGHMISMGVCLLLGGLCGALALVFLYKTGVFFLGCIGGLIASYHALSTYPADWTPLAILGLGVLGGGLALWLEKPAMTLALASIGAWLMTAAALSSLENSGVFAREQLGDWESWLPMAIFGVWAVLAVVGAGIQFGGGGKSKPKDAG